MFYYFCLIIKKIIVFFLSIFVLINIINGEKYNGQQHSQHYPWLEQITRHEQLIKECRHVDDADGNKHGNILNYDLSHLLVEHSHKLLYCYVPKIACTNWKRVFMVLSGLTNTTSLVSIPGSLAHAENSTLRLSYLNDEDIKQILYTYTTFIVVRHPFERLLSAYRNKFENTYSEYFRQRYGRDIIRKYRKNPTEDEILHANNVTFREFVSYLIDGGYTKNEHWTPIYQLCHPCKINYTLIARYETLSEDTKMILDFVGASFIDFPITRSSNTYEKLKRYYMQLSIHEVKTLYKLYWPDFKLFGYNLEDLLGYDFGL